MLNIKSLSTGVAVTALVSAIGLSYAQTPTNPPVTDTNPTATNPAPMTNTMPSSRSTTNPSDTLNNTMTEPAPRADRN
jgi:hypothetical protein